MVRQGLDPIKQREKDKRHAVRNLHVLRDVALDAFESRKAELKGDGKAHAWEAQKGQWYQEHVYEARDALRRE